MGSRGANSWQRHTTQEKAEEMKIRAMGRTGLKVSKYCLGTMTFGPKEWGCDEATAQRILDEFVGAGGNFVDTANIYGLGLSEEITGRIIKDKRKQIVLATKCVAPMGRGPNDMGASRKHILDSIDDSLRRLGTDYVDLYQVHGFDSITPIEETMRALDDCVRSGKVRYIGCSNYTAWQIAKSNAIAREMGGARFDCSQPEYSLISRGIEYEHTPFCRNEGIGVIPYSPLGGGILTGKVRRDQAAPDGSRAAMGPSVKALLTDKNYEIAETLIRVAKRMDKTPSQVALAWTAEQKGITSPIIGARTVDQIRDNLGALDVEFDDDARQELHDVSALPAIYPYNREARVREIRAMMNLEDDG